MLQVSSNTLHQVEKFKYLGGIFIGYKAVLKVL